MLFNRKTPKPIYITDTNELIDLGITSEVEVFEDGFRTNKDRGFFKWESGDDKITITLK